MRPIRPKRGWVKAKTLAELVSLIEAAGHHDGECLVLVGDLVKPRDYKYLCVTFQGRVRPAFQWVARHYLGEPPPGQEVIHLCERGNAGCITREHLKYGTHSENQQRLWASERMDAYRKPPGHRKKMMRIYARRGYLRRTGREDEARQLDSLLVRSSSRATPDSS